MGCHNDQENLKDIESDDEEVTIDDFLAVKSIINESLEVVSENLQDILIRNRQQKKMADYFNL